MKRQSILMNFKNEMDMNEYEEAYYLSCDLITKFSDIEVPEEYIGMMAAV